MSQQRRPVPTSTGDRVFMVEAYRSTAVADETGQVHLEPGTLVGVIDIPLDAVILYLVHAPDGPTAERLIRDRGGRPIRVVDVRWSPEPG